LISILATETVRLMFTTFGSRPTSHRDGHARRDFLKIGGLALGGYWLESLRAECSAAASKSAIRACIFIFYYGGPSHLDTYDMKPNAASNIRGEFNPISTSVPGLAICEHLPHMAKVMHRCALIRSMHHRNRLHDSASIETLTGRPAAQGDREEFAPIEQFFPCHGATVSHLRQDRHSVVPHAALPFVFHNVIDVPCQGGGFLGANYDPLPVSVDPSAGTYAVGPLALPADIAPTRLEQRRRLLDDLARVEGDAASGDTKAVRELRRLYDRAFDLLVSSDLIRRALDLSQEPITVRERYGIYAAGNHIDSHTMPGGPKDGYARHMRGQNLLVARRLVEAGVPFVNVYDYKQQGLNWDSHSNNFELHRRDLLPPADKALAALINDLDERGLLESTLVVATGEFGRTPKINKDAGRDHWPDCYTTLLAGGGVAGGAVYGASDMSGAYPAVDPVTPADLAATIFWRFGLDPKQHIHDRTQRPWTLADGEPVKRLFPVS
jgi:hypothetical protein